MRGLAILLGFNFLGLLLSKLAHVPFPGNVIGLVLFTACLFSGIVRLEWVEGAAAFLLRHMLLFFAPYVVGIVACLSLLRREWPAALLGAGGSFFVVLLVTGWVATLLLRKQPAENANASSHAKAGDA